MNLPVPRPVVPVMETRPSDPEIAEPFDGVTWERIRWPDDEPLPSPGHELNLADGVDGRPATRLVRVVAARPDFEPGWIGVEVVRV